MKRICCYCKRVYGNALKRPPGTRPGTVSHGICPDCAPIADREADRAIAKMKEEQCQPKPPSA